MNIYRGYEHQQYIYKIKSIKIKTVFHVRPVIKKQSEISNTY